MTEGEVVAVDEQGMEIMDDDQLLEYAELVEELGTRAEKLTVNSLSTIAEDYAASQTGADAVYQCLKRPLIDNSVSSDRKIPIIMAIDSILKNAKGQYIPIIEEDAKFWMPILYDKLAPGRPRDTLERVWKIWRDVGIFSESSWKQMGSCFSKGPSLTKFHKDGTGSGGSIALVPSAGALRKQMQQLLDEVQSNVTNELDKVSLERLAEINPDLLQNIKGEAEKMMTMNLHQSQSSTSVTANESIISSFFVETRTQSTITRSKDWVAEWEKPSLKAIDAKDLVKGIQDMIVSIPSSGALYSQHEAIQMTSSLGAAGAALSSLEAAIQSLNDQEQASLEEGAKENASLALYTTFVDQKLFTNEGVKKRDPSVIAGLYEVGLPFTSSADGRRFKTQSELSNHLDFLFKRNQLEKSMERTEERGWYAEDLVWIGEVSQIDLDSKNPSDVIALDSSTASLEEVNPESFTVPADENQERCAVCDLSFKMFFDNDDGIYKYKNCKEITVLLDDAAEKESEERLVHVTCWKALGSPEELTMDQVLERHGAR
mmetsp:Transcript_8246/g.12684  ORF Transcript_8246/g.12684 Transcript_8246/m.12684 type:complete len:544 (-) Transcript_8246:186-1817(-)